MIVKPNDKTHSCLLHSTDSYTQIPAMKQSFPWRSAFWFQNILCVPQPNRWGTVGKWKHPLAKIEWPSMAIGSIFNGKLSKRYWTSMPSDLIMQHFPCKAYLIKNMDRPSTAILHIPNVHDQSDSKKRCISFLDQWPQCNTLTCSPLSHNIPKGSRYCLHMGSRNYHLGCRQFIRWSLSPLFISSPCIILFRWLIPKDVSIFLDIFFWVQMHRVPHRGLYIFVYEDWFADRQAKV